MGATTDQCADSSLVRLSADCANQLPFQHLGWGLVEMAVALAVYTLFVCAQSWVLEHLDDMANGRLAVAMLGAVSVTLLHRNAQP